LLAPTSAEKSGRCASSTGVGTATKDIADAGKKVVEVITDVAGAFDTFGGNTQTLAGIELLSQPKPFEFGTSGVNTNTLAGILAASNGLPTVPTFNPSAARRADEVGNTYITVNGALDPEAVSRQIQTILNDSQARGTLGAGALRTDSAAL